MTRTSFRDERGGESRSGLLAGRGEAVADAGRRFDVKDVGILVPTVRVVKQVSFGGDEKWAMFYSKSIHARASRTSICPEDHRIGRRVALALNVPIEQVAIMFSVDREISGIHVKSGIVVQSWKVRDFVHFVGSSRRKQVMMWNLGEQLFGLVLLRCCLRLLEVAIMAKIPKVGDDRGLCHQGQPTKVNDVGHGDAMGGRWSASSIVM